MTEILSVVLGILIVWIGLFAYVSINHEYNKIEENLDNIIRSTRKALFNKCPYCNQIHCGCGFMKQGWYNGR